MKNRKSHVIIAAVALIATACSEESIIQPTDVVPSLARAGGKSSAKSNKGHNNSVTICHFPRGKGGNAQVISVGAGAAAAHIAQHEGDGIVDVDYDENCQPLVVTVLHAWAQGPLFTYQDNPDGARHFPFGVGLVNPGFHRFCRFTDPGLVHPLDLVLNDGTIIGFVSVDCSTLDEMSMTITITDGGYVLQEIEGLTDNATDCSNLPTNSIPLTDLSQFQTLSTLVVYASKAAEGLTTATMGPFDGLQVFAPQISCAVAHALVVPS
jgi:hypothetical protein